MPVSERVYRQYDRSGLDAEYDNVRKKPDFDFSTYLQRLALLNDKARQDYRGCLRRDVSYGDGADEVLDLFLPRPGGPLHVFFHGGYWRMLHKDDFSYVALGVLPHEVNLAVVNYSLIPAVSMGGLVDQCARAIRYLLENSEALGFDRRQVSISGHSAGGHLAAMMAATRFEQGSQVHGFTHVCALSGIFDLEPIQRCFLNDTLDLSDEDVARFSPLRRKRIHMASMMVLTGGEEGDEYRRQARTFVQSWSSQGRALELCFAPGHDHFSLRAALSEPDSEVTRAVLGRAL